MLDDIDRQIARLAVVIDPAAILGPPGEVLRFKRACEAALNDNFAGDPDVKTSSGFKYRGLPIYRCYEIGSLVVVSQWVVDALRERAQTVIF